MFTSVFTFISLQGSISSHLKLIKCSGKIICGYKDTTVSTRNIKTDAGHVRKSFKMYFYLLFSETYGLLPNP